MTLPRYLLRQLLKPVLRLCLRHAIKLQEILEEVKLSLLELAQQEMVKLGEQINVSRLSLMTGVHRKDVIRILDQPQNIKQEENLLSRIIGMWKNSAEFRSISGRPKTLSTKGKNSEFAHLVRSVSRELNPYSVLFELERSAMVERSPGGIKLKAQVYVPKGDYQQSLQLLARDSEDLAEAVLENISENETVKNLHIKTEYDNISPMHLSEIKHWLLKEGDAFHERASRYLASFDKDITPGRSKEEGRARISLGSFSLVQKQ